MHVRGFLFLRFRALSIEVTAMATFIKSDLEFILQQILISEAHAAGGDLLDLLPNVQCPGAFAPSTGPTTIS